MYKKRSWKDQCQEASEAHQRLSERFVSYNAISHNTLLCDDKLRFLTALEMSLHYEYTKLQLTVPAGICYTFYFGIKFQ